MISENFKQLFEEAKKVREKAHVPYSHFKVGAALLTEDKKNVDKWGFATMNSYKLKLCLSLIMKYLSQA